MLKKIKVISIAIISLIVINLFCMSSRVNAAQKIYVDGRMKDGKNIYYWVDSGNSYADRINESKNKLRYPKGLWNPIVLNRTYTKSYSKMDLYEIYDSTSDANAYTQYYKAKTNGSENIAYINELDYIEWIYNKIFINDYHMRNYDNDLQSTVILHEMCHCYGGADVYDNSATIMYGWTPVVRGMTKDFNDILVQKYNY
jgi:hypothetical protein